LSNIWNLLRFGNQFLHVCIHFIGGDIIANLFFHVLVISPAVLGLFAMDAMNNIAPILRFLLEIARILTVSFRILKAFPPE
jgi:hypothetical protein